MGRFQPAPASARISVVNKVPFDVWQLISRFIPREELVKLGLVNRHLYLIATKARYESVVISNFDKRVKKLCQDLRDEDIRRGRLVRRFEVKPWFVEPQFGLLPQPTQNQTPFRKLLSAASDCFHPESVQAKLQKQVTKRVEKGIKNISKAVRGMKRLQEFIVTWDEDNPYHPELYRALLGPVLQELAGHLTVLKLSVPTEMLHHLYPIALPHLEHLEVNLCTLGSSGLEIETSFQGFIVFLNNLFKSLKVLSIACRAPSSNLDLGKLFTFLGTFPKLHTFSLSIPFDGVNLREPQHLTDFLAKHAAHLQHLHLQTTRCGTFDTPADPACKYWVPNILSSNHYPDLRGLQLALRPLRADLTPIHKFLALHATNLTSLSLTDRALELHDVKAILACVGADEVLPSTELTELKMRVRRLTPALLNLIATRLPQLQVLELTFDEIRATASHVAGDGTPVRLPKQEFALFERTIKDSRERYAQWNLTTLGLSQGRITPWLTQLVRLFLECIPALQDVIELPPLPLF